MEIEDLCSKAMVATDLSEKGAARGKITGTDIEVDQREYEEATIDRRLVLQTVKVNVSALTTSSGNLSQQIQQIIRQLEQKQLDPVSLETAKKQLVIFEEEPQRPKQRGPKVRKILRWASGLGEELFLRLVVMWAERYGLSGVS